MTTNKTSFLPANKKDEAKSRKRVIATYLGSALVGALLSLCLFVRSDWDRAVVIACVGYAVVASIFLLVQIWGFIASQAFYCDALEQSKFKILEREAAEWERA